MFRKLFTAIALVSVSATTTVLGHEARQHQAAAGAAGVGSEAYAFPLPKPGSYDLPQIKQAAGGLVLDERGRTRNLSDMLRGRVTILAFIYTRCGDICPVASMQMSFVQDLAAKDPKIAARMQLVSMSFDPEHDTPAVMAEHATIWRSQSPNAPRWQFVTAPDRVALTPVLAAYNQTIGLKRNPKSLTGPFTHIFRAFLIDPSGQIRNIYSLDFLDPKLVLTDIRTLVLEDQSTRRQGSTTQ
jgi:protein SCO1/2